jgi:hypothetical protein
MPTPILPRALAEAIYRAMCELNNLAICDGLRITVPAMVNGECRMVTVEETDRDVIRVNVGLGLKEGEREHHAGQAAFATAYGIN